MVHGVVSLELSQLKYFVKVAQTGSFTKAAEELYISQPAVSKAVRNLEDELGVPLFARVKNNLVINEYGVYVLHCAKEILGRCNRLETGLQRLITNTELREIRFIASSVWPMHHFAPLFYAVHPEIEIKQALYPNDTALMEALQLQKGDIAFSLQPLLGDGISYMPLGEDRFLLKVPENHPWHDRPWISVRELRDIRFIMLEDTEQCRAYNASWQAENQIQLDFISARDPYVYDSMLRSGKTPVLTSTLELKSKGLSRDGCIPVRGKGMRVPYYVNYLPGCIQRYGVFFQWVQSSYADIMK